jgi:hypothetical protein
VRKCASPDSVGFLGFDSVGETLGEQRALSTERFGGSDRVLPGVFVGEVFGEENLGDVLAGDTTGVVYQCGKFAVGLSPVAHKVNGSGGF